MKSITTTPCIVPESCREQIQPAGFTFVELLVVLAVLALLLAVVLPALANTKPRAQRITCVNNLSRVGEAFNTWAGDHSERLPMQVASVDGGLRDHPTGLQNNLWFQFVSISNQLVTPGVLVCPSDPAGRSASNWGLSASGGFIHPNFQNNAVSYMLAHPFPEYGRAVLSGDRNISGTLITADCAYFALAMSVPQGSTTAAWDNSIHVGMGNLLFNDGSVEQTDSPALRRSVSLQPDTNPGIHFLTR